MMANLGLSRALDALIPISRFNKGEANKIFDEVRASGCKIVVKNNAPACVLITPERYKEMVDALEDGYLLSLALEREANDTGDTHSMEELLAEDGLTLADIEAMEDVEIE
ncbi:MAG: type II toxin-antitoxin system Phd/YefM family antitoxin [Peptococcaceae bacterium]|jgi:PHD/YefM family antitoxin component YafN of YafNO toxin-antitoxin module|nr:type II toxin-antitoxin system Phd/YefM family antitoxin [Peptococcaceae bacterium]